MNRNLWLLLNKIGSAITVSGTVISLAAGGTQVVIAGRTSLIGGVIITPLSTGHQ